MLLDAQPHYDICERLDDFPASQPAGDANRQAPPRAFVDQRQ